MNVTPEQTLRLPAASRHHKRARLADESLPVKELRNLRGLSAEVGAACSAWLTTRGIKHGMRERFRPGIPDVNSVTTEFHLHNDL